MQTAEDYWYENCFNTDEGYVLNKEDFFKYASQLHPPPTPSKELKSAAKVITEQIGIRLDAPKQTPMDKGECIVCMEAYASQLHPSPTPDVTEAVELDAIKFAEWLELEGYRIKGMDDTQRAKIYFMYKNGLAGKDMQNDITYPTEI